MSGTAATQPRGRIVLNGQACNGAERLQWTLGTNYQPGTWSATLDAGADPTFTPAWWGEVSTSGSTAPPVMAAIEVQLDAEQAWQPAFSGRVDGVDWNPATGTVTLDGRDRVADFIESKTFSAYKNQTASEIAQAFAAEHGMSAQVTATSTPVGRYYQTDHDRLTLGQFSRVTTEWDLLTSLAQFEGFDCFVQGSTLYFQPFTEPSATPAFTLACATQNGIFTSNGIAPRFHRSLTLARDIVVVVQSWNSRQKAAFEVSAKAIGAKSPSAVRSATQVGTPSTRYVFSKPNLTHEQAQQYANSLLADLSKHEREVSFTMPGELTLNPQGVLAVQGTGTVWDQSYFIFETSRSLSFDRGFEQTVVAKNQSPRDTAVVG